jgi:hypothetical protein
MRKRSFKFIDKSSMDKRNVLCALFFFGRESLGNRGHVEVDKSISAVIILKHCTLTIAIASAQQEAFIDSLEIEISST